jgi:hypothetical protein
LTTEPAGPFASICRSVATPKNVGAALSLTVTVKPPVAVLPAPSVAEQLTVVVPRGNVDPEGGVHDAGSEPETASVAPAEYVTVLPAAESASAVMFAGSSSEGGVVSWTVTEKDWAALVLPAASRAVQVTVVWPSGKVEPEG